MRRVARLPASYTVLYMPDKLPALYAFSHLRVQFEIRGGFIAQGFREKAACISLKCFRGEHGCICVLSGWILLKRLIHFAVELTSGN
ncbi:hypothetical protein U737_01755 [Methylomonas sp. LW13]|uniref:hypothetical protein n=1 Tax=unclassified Methylomonas TaxID=2608980 RepID=UPI00051AB480|nr:MULTISPECIES: hypothetical protein [unclassified Methylomonas]PKD42234.1 hypothetical protein CWO84_00070 [Methylomonas sp. Kb3]QBC25737.1 hypothetical protein U737_01755 [Methylomonas sp. LW13]